MDNIDLMIHQKPTKFFSHKLSLHIIIMYHKSSIKPPGGAYLFQANLRGREGGGLIEKGAYLRGRVI